eukprot:TRINITY_DN68637_c0_g1_i1.p1 TRINITY_DN68637_c0_g1~~TRINITY_DN68637_c0_g1_i1.p1  ORF type:complete len:269 (-),score=31.27 TRINITY_DN68637_c0_g1_i1:29-835(-)
MPRYINGSYGVFTSPTAVKDVADNHLSCFARTHQPQLNFSNDRVTTDDRLAAKSTNYGQVFGEKAPYRFKTAPLAHKDQTSSRMYHNEKPSGDGEANFLLAESFRGPRRSATGDVPFTLFGAGSLYAQDFEKISKKKRRAARSAPASQNSPRNPYSMGASAEIESSSRNAAQKVWQCKTLTGKMPERPGPVHNLQLTGVHSDHLIRSQSQLTYAKPQPTREGNTGQHKAEASSAVASICPNARPKKQTTVHVGLMGVGAGGLGHLVGL